MSTIPERSKKWDSAWLALRDLLDRIPFTTTQRKDIGWHLDTMARLFDEANAPKTD